LERERASADPRVRGQIQSESVQIGLAMQHLGALLLELGRTMLTLRMGQSSVCFRYFLKWFGLLYCVSVSFIHDYFQTSGRISC